MSAPVLGLDKKKRRRIYKEKINLFCKSGRIKMKNSLIKFLSLIFFMANVHSYTRANYIAPVSQVIWEET